MTDEELRAQAANEKLQRYSDRAVASLIAKGNDEAGQTAKTAATAFVDGSTYLTPAHIMHIMSLSNHYRFFEQLIDIRVNCFLQG
jgi:hypothetical protein